MESTKTREGKIGQAADVVKVDAVTVLQTLNKGMKMFELSVALEQLTAAVRATGKQGHITMKITMQPTDADANQVFMITELNGKMPRPDEKPTLFYTTDQNGLVRNDPRQMDMGLEA